MLVLVLPPLDSHRISVCNRFSHPQTLITHFLRFQAGLMDSLNAEIALGTVAHTRDAVQWLGYTYLFVRMRMNPFLYGMLLGPLSFKTLR